MGGGGVSGSGVRGFADAGRGAGRFTPPLAAEECDPPDRRESARRPGGGTKEFYTPLPPPAGFVFFFC